MHTSIDYVALEREGGIHVAYEDPHLDEVPRYHQACLTSNALVQLSALDAYEDLAPS